MAERKRSYAQATKNQANLNVIEDVTVPDARSDDQLTGAWVGDYRRWNIQITFHLPYGNGPDRNGLYSSELDIVQGQQAVTFEQGNIQDHNGPDAFAAFMIGNFPGVGTLNVTFILSKILDVSTVDTQLNSCLEGLVKIIHRCSFRIHARYEYDAEDEEAGEMMREGADKDLEGTVKKLFREKAERDQIGDALVIVDDEDTA